MSRGISFSQGGGKSHSINCPRGVGHATNCVRGEPIPFQLTVQGGTDMLLIVSRGAKSHSIDCPGGAAY